MAVDNNKLVGKAREGLVYFLEIGWNVVMMADTPYLQNKYSAASGR
jgi:hypothetical protein